MQLTTLLVPTYTHMLKTLSGWLKKAHAQLPEAEAQALLSALDGVDFAGHCPHGRPIVSFTSWSELERKVGRR